MSIITKRANRDSNEAKRAEIICFWKILAKSSKTIRRIIAINLLAMLRENLSIKLVNT